jgi:Peptidase family M28
MNDSAITRRQALAGAAAVGSLPLVGADAAYGKDLEEPSGPRPRPRPGDDVSRMLSEISAANIRRTVEKLASFGTRNTLSSQSAPDRGIGAARDWLFDEFKKAALRSGGRMRVELQSYRQPVASRIPVPTVITNVVATLRGSRPDSVDRTYVVSGHYDSMPTGRIDAVSDAPGADDDASGVAAVLEMARVMATRRFDATLVFMAVAGEEQGLYGANHFAEVAERAGTNIAGMFTNDIIGSSVGGAGQRDPFRIRVFAEGLPNTPSPLEADWRRFGGGETESKARQLARYVKEVAENEATRMKVRIIYRRDRLGRGGDHIPFLNRGWPAVRFTEPNEDYRHQHQNVRVENGVQIGDLPEFVDYDYIARAARVNAAALTALARSPAVPTGALINTAGQRADTELRWSANTESDLAGYEIVKRATTDLEWGETIPVGNVTRTVLRNTAKDNYFFGIRAVDKSGNRSPAAFPRPT